MINTRLLGCVTAFHRFELTLKPSCYWLLCSGRTVELFNLLSMSYCLE